jgi:hypothetical protein
MPTPEICNWGEVEAEFITGYETLKEISIRVGINEKTLYGHSSTEGWKKKREEYRATILKDLTDRSAKEAVDSKDLFDTRTDAISDITVAVLAERLATDYKQEKKMTLKEYNEIIFTTRAAQDVKYRRLNIPAPKLPIETSHPQSPADDLDREMIMKIVAEKITAGASMVPMEIKIDPEDNGRDEPDNGGA